MYLTMNRFKVAAGQDETFTKIWTGRGSHLPQVPGFASFHLFKVAEENGVRFNASHRMWVSEASFTAWPKSAAIPPARAGIRA